MLCREGIVTQYKPALSALNGAETHHRDTPVQRFHAIPPPLQATHHLQQCLVPAVDAAGAVAVAAAPAAQHDLAARAGGVHLRLHRLVHQLLALCGAALLLALPAAGGAPRLGRRRLALGRSGGRVGSGGLTRGGLLRAGRGVCLGCMLLLGRLLRLRLLLQLLCCHMLLPLAPGWGLLLLRRRLGTPCRSGLCRSRGLLK